MHVQHLLKMQRRLVSDEWSILIQKSTYFKTTQDIKIGPQREKTCLWGLQTTMAQTSLRIRTV